MTNKGFAKTGESELQLNVKIRAPELIRALYEVITSGAEAPESFCLHDAELLEWCARTIRSNLKGE